MRESLGEMMADVRQFVPGVRQEYSEDVPKRHNGIKCMDCHRLLSSKQEAVKNHRGHDVQYVGDDGEIDG